MRLFLSSALCLGMLCAAPGAQESAGRDVLWHDLGDLSALNLIYGVGGEAHAPDPNGVFTFIKEDPEGTNPKFEVDDAAGVRWRVKLGPEAQPETVATRLVWAAGYFVDEDYYLPEVTISGLTELQRGKKLVSPDGKMRGAEFERKPRGVKNRGNWDWFANPFIGTREENGLRVMMALINNWDLKEVNNSIDEVDGERRYQLSDLGATFGNTGNYFTRSKGVLDAFAKTAFVERSTPEFVDLTLHSRPFVLTAINVPHYREYSRMEQVAKHIPVADARWIADRLSQLSAQQLGDAFRAAGYSPSDVDGYVKVIQQRIAALRAL
jgi:hypothetical protein